MTRAYDHYRMLPREHEVANLEHELTVLRQRHANLDRAGRTVVYASWVLAPALLLSLAIIMISGNYGLALTLLAACVLAALIALLLRLVPDNWWPIYYSESYPYPTHFEFLENAIAEREKRLAELRTGS